MDSKDLWLIVYRALCMMVHALEKYLGFVEDDKNKC